MIAGPCQLIFWITFECFLSYHVTNR